MDDYARKRVLDSLRPASPTKYPEHPPRPSRAKRDPFSTYLESWAHPSVVHIWSDEEKVREERRLWILIMEQQRKLGVDIPEEAIRHYRGVVNYVDFDRIARRERVTRHDVKARLEEFNACAGHEHAHKGMTGRDLDDNLEQAMILRTMDFISQFVPDSVKPWFQEWADRYPMRGISGPMGTAQDMLDLFEGDLDKVRALNQAVADHYGFKRIMDSTGQVYPRSMDYEAGCLLMAAVHRSELKDRCSGQLRAILRGYVTMLGELAGGQWLEGDVSCSAVRRVALPGMFLSASAVFR